MAVSRRKRKLRGSMAGATPWSDLVKQTTNAIRRLILARPGRSIASVARDAGVPRARLNNSLNMRENMTLSQWMAVLKALGVDRAAQSSLLVVLETAITVEGMCDGRPKRVRK